MYRRILLITLLACLVWAPSLHAGERKALVIGISKYKKAPLANPVNDARDMGKALTDVGFKVTLITDANRKKLRKAIRNFGSALTDRDVGLFYFAGHGIQVEGQNYLIPIGADIKVADEIPDETVSMQSVIRKMNSAQNTLNIIILDACRNNPFESTMTTASRGFPHSASRGLRRVTGPVGSYIAYATAPGDVSADGRGRNGLFTQHLLKHIRSSGLTIQQMMTRVRSGVIKDSNNQQIPWENSALTGDFYFVPGGKAAPAPVAAKSEEQTLWDLASTENSLELYRLYLKKYPNGSYRSEAKAKLQRRLGADQGAEIVAKADYEYFDLHNYKTALSLYRKAADMGSPSAMASYAKMLMIGRGLDTGPDPIQAKRWSERAVGKLTELADSGHAFSQYQLATLYAFIYQDPQKGVTWYRKAADQGNSFAMNNLAVAYKDGIGIARDTNKALYWFKAAIKKGQLAALNNLGYMYDTGQGVKTDDKLAHEYYLEAAEKGHASAMSHLGALYEYGEGVKKDLKKAHDWYLEAANKGDAEAMTNLGSLYDNGKGVSADKREAMRWYRKAADKGYPTALYNVGYNYQHGEGTRRDYRQAFQWYQKAVNFGSINAMTNLGWLYENGKGVKKNRDKAIHWYRQAARRGHDVAQDNLKKMGKNW